MTDTRNHTQPGKQAGPQSALGAASDAARRAGQSLEANPLGILVGGLAVGAIAGALLPRSAREQELLAPVGKRLSTSARAAIDAAKEAGRTELESRGFTRDAGQEQVKNLLGGLGKALSTAGTAAVASARGKATDAGQDTTAQASDGQPPAGQSEQGA